MLGWRCETDGSDLTLKRDDDMFVLRCELVDEYITLDRGELSMVAALMQAALSETT